MQTLTNPVAPAQARQMDPEYGRQAGDEDGWDEALGYMDACGPGWHLQIARTTSDDGLANTGSLISHPSGLSTCFLGDSQPRSVRSHCIGFLCVFIFPVR